MKLVLDERVKHRLIGLVVIVCTAAIFLPALMKKSNQRFEENVSISVHLPAKPLAPKVAVADEKTMFQSVKVAKADIPAVIEKPRANQIAKAEPISIKSTVPIAPILNKEPIIAKAETLVVPAVKTAVLANKVVKPAKEAAQAIYAVQLASFTQKINAEQLVTRLRSKGFKASYNKSMGKQGEYYKVIVGQVKQRNEAKNLQKQLLASMQMNGFIIKAGVS